MAKFSPRLLASAITTFIILAFILLGPAQALILKLTIPDTTVSYGSIINFIVSAKIEHQEKLKIDYLNLQLEGPSSIDCKFLENTTKLSGCDGIEIKQLTTAPYQYGYGYGYLFTEGTLSYNISLNTSLYKRGNYKTKLVLSSNKKEFEFSGENIIISSAAEQACSIRAENGLLKFDSKISRRNSLNFHVPLQKAAEGQGALTAQEGRKRFYYKFSITGLIENTNKSAIFISYGEYRTKANKTINTEALIYLDKINNKLNVTSQLFNATNMDITLMKEC